VINQFKADMEMTTVNFEGLIPPSN